MDKAKDFKLFCSLMMAMQEIFTPDKPISKEKVEIYWRTFSHWTLKAYEDACMGVIRTKTIHAFPLVSEIFKAHEGSAVALQAWLHSREIVAQHGSSISVQFADRVIHSVIEAMGGWLSFCNCPDKERPWKQREFERLYPIMLEKASHPPYVVGRHELNNWGQGHKEVDTLVVIPDPKQGQKKIEKSDA